jgi:tetratricopeptide (TPR) repeat protein
MEVFEVTDRAFQLARGFITRGNHVKGYHLLSRLLETHPTYIPGRLLRGEMLYQQRRFKTARTEFLHVLKIDPENERACIFLGLISGIDGRITEGRRFFERALEQIPEDTSVRWLLADSCFQLGEFDLALAHLEQVLSVNPEDVRSLCDVAYCHFHQGALDTALEWFQRALEVEPGHPAACLDIAKIWILRGMSDHAHHYLRRLLKTEPASKEVLTTLAYMQYYLGQPQNARLTLGRALALDGSHLPALLLLGGLELMERKSPEEWARTLGSLSTRELLLSQDEAKQTFARRIWLPLECPAPYRLARQSA